MSLWSRDLGDNLRGIEICDGEIIRAGDECAALQARQEAWGGDQAGMWASLKNSKHSATHVAHLKGGVGGEGGVSESM